MSRTESHRKWQQENKEKVREYNRKWQQENKEKMYEANKRWRKNNPEKVKEIEKRTHQRFIETHNWSKYVSERRKARVQRLREQGVKNAWAVVINGKEAKYREEKDEYAMQ